MATIEERAMAAAISCIEWCFNKNQQDKNGITHNLERLLKEQREIDIEKACEVYKSELKELTDIITKFGEIKGIDNLGDIINIDGSLRDFRKAMMED